MSDKPVPDPKILTDLDGFVEANFKPKAIKSQFVGEDNPESRVACSIAMHCPSTTPPQADAPAGQFDTRVFHLVAVRVVMDGDVQQTPDEEYDQELDDLYRLTAEEGTFATVKLGPYEYVIHMTSGGD